MKREYIAILPIAVACVLAFLIWNKGRHEDAPAVIPTPTSGPDVLAVLKGNPDKSQAKLHAEYLKRIGVKTAYRIEKDGQQSSPDLKMASDAASYRNKVRRYLTDELSFAPQYPALAASLAGYLDSTVGKTDGPLTPDSRQKWVEAMKVIANNSAYAAQELAK